MVLKVVRRRLISDAVCEARRTARQGFRQTMPPRFACGECTMCFGMRKQLERHKALPSCDPEAVRDMQGFPKFRPTLV